MRLTRTSTNDLLFNHFLTLYVGLVKESQVGECKYITTTKYLLQGFPEVLNTVAWVLLISLSYKLLVFELKKL